MCLVGPRSVLRACVDYVAVLVDSIAVVSRGDQVDVVAVAAARVPSDAVEDLCAVQQVADIFAKSVPLDVKGHLSPPCVR
jgi:hypothetical protein